MKKKKLTQMLIVSGLLMSAQYSFAQSVPFPAIPYLTGEMTEAGCDPSVYSRMHAQAAKNFAAAQKAREKLFIKDQLEASPKDATNKMLSCVDSAVKQLDGLVSNVTGIYNMITGAGNVNLAALGANAVNKIGNAACTALNNYTGGAVYSAVQPYNSAITSLPTTIANQIGSVATPVGNVNVGQMAVDAVKQQAGPQQSSTIVKDSISGIVGGALK